jgi:hypothetical protein
MAQRRNSVVLSDTAIAKLQKLVDSGEYCSVDDAATHILCSVLLSTPQYSAVPTQKQAVLACTQSEVLASTPEYLPVLASTSTKAPLAGFFDSDIGD